MNIQAHHAICNLHDTNIFRATRLTETTKHACVYHILLNTKKDESCRTLASVHWIGLANCRRRSLTIMTSRTMRTQLHPSGTKASSGVFEDQEQRDFQKTFITQRVHCMCWHNARRYKNQYSFILDCRDFPSSISIMAVCLIGTKKYCQIWRHSPINYTAYTALSDSTAFISFTWTMFS